MPKGKGGNVKRAISGAGPRIWDELKARDIPVTVFQREMEGERKIRGSAYSTVWSYLKGRVEPAAEFVREAGDYLGVREEYLIKGELPKTEGEHQVSRQENLSPGSPMVERVLESRGWPPGPRALFHEAWRRYVAGATDAEIPEDTLLRLGASLLVLVQTPSRLWGFQHEMSARQQDDFAVAMLQALMLAMPESGKGDSLEDIDERYPTTAGKLSEDNDA